MENENNNLMVFEGHNVEVFEWEGKVLFNPKHVAECLDIKNVNDNIRKMNEKQVIKLTNSKIGETDFRKLHNTGENFLTESGVYKLIFKSHKEEAEKFQDWVTDEVLPTIRKTVSALETIEFKGNIDNLVYSKDGKPITTSKCIAEVTGKEHFHILRDIREEIAKLNDIHNPKLDNEEISLIINDFKEIKYIANNGQTYTQYELGEMATMQLMLKYSTEFRARFILSFQKMKQSLNNMFKAKLIESVLPQDNRNRQYVYIIKNPLNETIKIGVANDVEKRMKQLQTGAGIELELIYKSLICSNAFSIEKDVHKHFENYRTFGEWFKINPTDVINFLEKQTFVLKSEFVKYVSLAC